MGSYQIHNSCYSKERTRKMESQTTVGKSWPATHFQHQKTSITTLTYLDSIVSPSMQFPGLKLLSSAPAEFHSLCLYSSVCLEQTQSLPLFTSSSCPPAPSESRFLSNHLISQAHPPSDSSQGLFKPLPLCETSALFLHFLRS